MIEMILSYLVVLVAVVAVTSPLWVWAIKSAEKSETDRLEDTIAYIQRADAAELEQLIILMMCRRLLLQSDPTEGYALLVEVHG